MSNPETMKPGEVIRAVRDAIKLADLPGGKRVARKGSHILFDVGGETYSCAIKRVTAKGLNTKDNRNSPFHEDSAEETIETDGINTGT